MLLLMQAIIMRQNFVSVLSLAYFLHALCWITLSTAFKMPYSAFSLNLAAISHLCGGGGCGGGG